jgi:tetratricopeptide (TPR) repeat protein
MVLNGMNIDPDLPVITSWNPTIILEASMLLIFFIIGINYFKKRPCIGFGILWFFLHLIPTNSLVPRLDIANDRQLYLASMGIFLIIAVEGKRLICYLEKQYVVDQSKILYTSLALVLLMLSYFTVTRNHAYRSEISLWEDSRAKSPYKARVHNNLGYAYYLDGRVSDAKKAYLTALRLNPDYRQARNNLKSLH